MSENSLGTDRHNPTSQKMTSKAVRFIQSIANVHFNKTSNITQFRNQIPSNTFKTALMSSGQRQYRQILLATKLRQNFFSRYFVTHTQCIVQQRRTREKARQGKGDTLLYFTVVTLFVYMTVTNYSHNK